MNEIALHILDIVQNSIRAGATLIIITVALDITTDMLTVSVEDNGCGMNEEYVRRVCDPFVTERTTRRIGLGLPLMKAGAEATGGSFEITSKSGEGTKVIAQFCRANIDCPPLGKMTDTIASQIACNPDIDFVYDFSVGNVDRMVFDTREIRKILGNEVSLATPDVVNWISQSIDEETKKISYGRLSDG